MHQHAKLIEQFYTSFARRDPAGMIACYTPDVTFTDPVFSLQGKRAGAMWAMLCGSSSALEISFSGVEAGQNRGRAHWEAHYTFSAKQRKVHNIIEAEFTFSGGLIASHQDRFGFWRWSRQALGPTGWVLGWTPLVRGKVQRSALERLEKFIAEHPEYQG